MGIEFVVQTDSVDIIGEEAGMLKFRNLDFICNNISFINNLNDFYNRKEGIYQEINLADPCFDEPSYMFYKSPVKITAYLNESIEQLTFEVLEEDYFKLDFDGFYDTPEMLFGKEDK